MKKISFLIVFSIIFCTGISGNAFSAPEDGACARPTVNFQKIRRVQPRFTKKVNCVRCALRVSEYLASDDENALYFTIKDRYDIYHSNAGSSLNQVQSETMFRDNLSPYADVENVAQLRARGVVPDSVVNVQYQLTRSQIEGALGRLGNRSVALVSGDIIRPTETEYTGHTLVAYNDRGTIRFLDSTHKNWFDLAMNDADSYFSRGLPIKGRNDYATWRQDLFQAIFASPY